MDWDANLAAVIKCTDENLAQQFRHFSDLTADLSAASADASSMGFAPQMAPPNLATAYFRDSIGASVRPVTATSSFADHFRTQQEHKRRGRGSPERRYAHDRPYRSQNNQKQQSSPQQTDEIDYDDNDAYTGPQRSARAYHMPSQQHMYTSPTYDIAQMMEQIRLSLKLEVDARAAIAERQLSALLQLCKSTSDEMDRLRIEVCAADRQLHTMDQVQAKMRQELTTQKDIGFHLQSLCGKDESWRIQADNQLLELRQMVAALREHGNAMQVATQDKLSRSELLVQFNAAMEPIKAQFQANLQHQAQQIADITRTSSSSTLMLDALTQKVNRGLTDEVMELRQELRALKSHVGKLTLAQGSVASVQSQPNPSQDEREIKQEKETRRKEKRQQLAESMETLERKCTESMKSLVEVRLEVDQNAFQAKLTSLAEKQETIGLQHKKIHEFCEARIAAVSIELDQRVKTVQQHVQDDLKAQLRSLKEKSELAIQLQATHITTLMDTKAGAWQARSSELQKLIELEQNERKQALDNAQEALRKCRYDFEDRLHTLTCDSRTKWAQQVGQMENSVQEINQRTNESVEALGRDVNVRLEAARVKIHALVEDRDEKLGQTIKKMNETIAQLSRSIEAVALEAAKSSTKVKSSEAEDSSSTSSTTKRERDIPKESANTYLSTMDALLQKMQLQLQLQTQAQMAVQAPHVAHHNYWPSSPYASTQFPPAPLLLSPPGTPMSAWQSAPPPISNPPEPVSTSEQKRIGGDSKILSIAATPKIDSMIIQDEKKPEPTSVITDTSALKQPEETVASSSAPAAKEWPRDSQRPVGSVATSPASSAVATEASDTVLKIQQTINSTAKGAMAEAEMAKSRVENRRRQELEMKQDQTRAPPMINTATDAGSSMTSQPASPNSAKTDPPSVPARPPIVPPPSAPSGCPPPPPPHSSLSRSMSTSSILPKGPESTPKPGVNDGIRGRSTSFSEPRDPYESPAPQPGKSISSPPAVAPSPATTAQAPANAVSQSSASNKPPMGGVPGPSLTASPAVLASPAPGQPARPSLGAAAFPERSQVSAPAATASAKPAPAAESMVQTTTKLYGNTPALTGPPSTPPPSHVLCSSCKLPLRAAQVTEHEQTQCIKRIVTCTKCSGRMPWIELEGHERGCQANITSESALDEKNAPGTSTMKKCRHCAADVPALELFDHELRCDKMLKQCPHCLRRQKAAELQEHIESCDCRLVACPNDCGGKFLQRGIEKHLATRCPKKPMAASSTSSPSPSGQPPETGKLGSKDFVNASSSSPALSRAPTPSTTSAPAVTPPVPQASKPSPTPVEPIECRFCDEEIPADEADSHEQTCDWKPQRCQYCNMVIISRDLVRHESSCKTSAKTCPHCNESMLQSALPTHTARCSKRPIKCIRCCQLFPADSIVAHSTNCKFIPSSSTVSTASASASSVPQVKPPTPGGPGATGYQPVDATRGKVPPPPPYPPTRAASNPAIKVSDPAPANGQSMTTLGKIISQARPDPEESMVDRLARRSLALSQLTNTASASTTVGSSAINPSAAPSTSSNRSLGNTGGNGAGPEHEEDDHDIDDEDEEADDEDVDEDNMTLAEVVAEWNVENVCLWLHEDVGVPEVVPRFQQRQCNGEMLLDLTESDLINDFGIKNRSHREQILNAIEAIKTSDEFSDDEDDEDEEDEDEDDDPGDVDDDDDVASLTATGMHRQSLQPGDGSFAHPRDLLRRNSSPSSPDRSPAGLPSSSAMVPR